MAEALEKAERPGNHYRTFLLLTLSKEEIYDSKSSIIYAVVVSC